ncbi:excinuclease ABC subunit B [Anaeroplasma bactoclasticum]|jgi:excinuclease ABC subunit B|uniref:UvrABC system protein B n=1 Tax=Anaeroplasma bactoclasticum TaxID=2088 RepID=A0A397RUG5_9MOLU|nr:excinuclease ABC subunit UvrB [Anaeroplasma bactoclasticum]RIA77970.1 excinuclease ABC subunit B [Anaeroplasma bactoclasticum]
MFKISSKYKPTGDQPEAIENIVKNYNNGIKRQTLLGVTGSGKTFTMANVIEKVGKPTLILAHNKTLAGQLYNEFKDLFPDNHVEYFISYYDYYQPEAYVVSSDTYIEKDAQINDEIDEMRHAATAALMDYKDVIVIASVSCIYGIGDPEDYKDSMLCIRVGEEYPRKKLFQRLVEMQFERNDFEFKRGTFRYRGDVLEIIPPSEHAKGLKIEFFDDEVERIRTFDVVTGKAIEDVMFANIFAATHFVTNKNKLTEALRRIKEELKVTKEKFLLEGKPLEAERIEQRTKYDLEMLEQTGSCSGVENYSRHLALRAEGETPATLIDFFPDDFLLIVDESHVTIPQVRGMYNGDRARKMNLVNYGFRLPSALDNRPLKFEEFDSKIDKALFVSATPAEFESKYPITEQIIRPTGLLDPIIEVKPSLGQVDDIYAEIVARAKVNERVLVTTLTIKMSEDLTDYLKKMGCKVAYLHSEIKALDRLEILRSLREGKYDVLVGINLLREGLDLPEVSLVCILDADKQGFLRSERSLIQTIGRAARNAKGKVILYADTISDSMRVAIDETRRRRDIQNKYNLEHNIIPKTIIKEIPKSLTVKKMDGDMEYETGVYHKNMTKEEKVYLIAELEEQMRAYARDLNFEAAAQIRDAILELKASK